MPVPSRVPASALAATVLAIVAAGCGSAMKSSALPSSANSTIARPGRPTVAPAPASIRRASWATLRLNSGAALPYPVGWRRTTGDPGTGSAAQADANGTIRSYLNVTPADPGETFTGWVRFRLRHNGDEGDREVRLISAHPRMPAAGGRRRACVVDEYTTSVTSYRELACLVASPTGAPGDVLVAAAQPRVWASDRSAFSYAFDHFTS